VKSRHGVAWIVKDPLAEEFFEEFAHPLQRGVDGLLQEGIDAARRGEMAVMAIGGVEVRSGTQGVEAARRIGPLRDANGSKLWR